MDDDAIPPTADPAGPPKPRSAVAQAIWTIKWVAVWALAGCFVYGLTGRHCAASAWSCGLAGGLVATLAATGAFAVGALLGLLFGAPRYKEASPQAAASAPAAGVGHNTSLERIADWLTTMIVGLGLVHLKEIKTEAAELGAALTQAITLEASPNGTPGIVIAIGFAIAGFLLVYLWSLRFLPNELLEAFQRIRQEVVAATDVAIRDKTQHIEQKIEKAASVLEDFKKSPVFSVSPAALQALAEKLQAADVPAELVEDIRDRYDRAKRWTDEPMRGFGPAAVEPYALDAVVRKLKPGWYEVAVTLHSPPVPGGRVVWLAHNSFSPELAAVMWIKPEGTRYVVEVSGAFNVGAVVVKPGATAVCLSLDLRGVPGSDAEFDAG